MSAFFIVGVQRSGTTMLSVLLGNHPDIFMEEKVNAFRIIASYQNMVDLLPFNLDIDQKSFQKWIVENDKSDRIGRLVDKNAIDNGQNYKESLRLAISKTLSENNCKVWGDKAPNLQHYIAELLLLIPDAKIIHIVRDGRATAASMTQRSYRNLKLSAQMWVDGNVCGLVNEQVLGKEQYRIVRYEDLLRKPEEEMKSLCAFLGVEFNPSVLNLSDQETNGKEYVKQFFDTSKIDQWKDQLTSKQIDIVEEIQGPTLKKFAYEVEDRNFKPVSLRQKLWLMQVDNWKNLFRKQKKGMKDRQVIEYNDSFKSRFKRFLMFYGNLFLSKEITKTLFSRYNYKSKIKRKTPDSQ
jgi:hypothetical protein